MSAQEISKQNKESKGLAHNHPNTAAVIISTLVFIMCLAIKSYFDLDGPYFWAVLLAGVGGVVIARFVDGLIKGFCRSSNSEEQGMTNWPHTTHACRKLMANIAELLCLCAQERADRLKLAWLKKRAKLKDQSD
ncbi:hypothetical protein [Pseudovibrio sp. Ad26]|uniref:hypothetical protein n=1 Tax=Pseudovibrio sp. Ad26 TaxID=989410 RepID=UPI0007AECCC7|nr:hypothetical protein [Pseudovibrio sp. Ad26]KZL05511.1 hypothetical protein PsAD26_04308 [Pseudovibrio sp. Ad26]